MEVKRPGFTSLSSYVQNAFHHMGIPELASTLFLLETFVSSRFRHDKKERSKSLCLRGAKTISCAARTAHGVFLEHVGLQQATC